MAIDKKCFRDEIAIYLELRGKKNIKIYLKKLLLGG
jgi:hypothetical protein